MEEQEAAVSSSNAASESNGVAPIAAAFAFGAAGPAKAEEFLSEQTALARLQKERLKAQDAHFHEEAELELKHLRWRGFADRMKGALQIATLIVGLAVMLAITGFVWKAAHAEGIVIDSFAVPPDYVQKGLTGDVLAREMQDRLDAVKNNGRSTNLGPGLSSGHGDDIKVEIPETGISVGEAYRFLRGWLGHESHVAGEVVHTAEGIAITVRIDGTNGATYTGPESDFSALVLKAAEHVAEVYDAPRFAVYLGALNPPRRAEALKVLERTVADPLANDNTRQRAWNNIAMESAAAGQSEKGLTILRRTVTSSAAPAAGLLSNLASSERDFDHLEILLSLSPRVLSALASDPANYRPDYMTDSRTTFGALPSLLRGDYADVLRRMPAENVPLSSERPNIIKLQALALSHDIAAAREFLQGLPELAPNRTIFRDEQAVLLAEAASDWPGVLSHMATAEAALQGPNASQFERPMIEGALRAAKALATAQLGDLASAEQIIGTTRRDCYTCLRVRGMLATPGRQWGRADYWFGQAAQQGPSLPMGYEDWGRTFLARNQPDQAIEKFKQANLRGPHFADPLEGWGEALMDKNQSHLAVAKFEEANKYAPNWGRLHLKWGEALVYAGKAAEAKAQLARAGQLDLTPSEKAELNSAQRPTGRNSR